MLGSPQPVLGKKQGSLFLPHASQDAENARDPGTPLEEPHSEVLGGPQLLTPGRPSHTACFVVPSAPLVSTRRMVLVLGPGGCSATGAGPAQRSLRSGDFLRLRNMGKSPATPLHPTQSPQPRALHSLFRGSLPHCPSVVRESLASTKHGGRCVPALVTLVL